MSTLTTSELHKRLAPCPGKRLPRSFKAAVALLQRPYHPLTADEYALVQRIAGDSDLVLFDGRQATFGDADGGKALMPLREEI
jgi:hypothetical protein